MEIGKRQWGRSGEGLEPGLWKRLLALALCFLAGLLLGQVVAGRLAPETAQELRTYLNGFFSLENHSEAAGQTALSTLAVYFRYPLLAALLGFASVGVVLLPVLTAAFAFFLSFSVCCFTAAFGPDGVLLALAVFGLRCAVTLPCYLALAAPALRNAAALAALSLGGGGRGAPPVYGRSWWLRCGIVAAVLILGIGLELALCPWLTALVLGRIFGV